MRQADVAVEVFGLVPRRIGFSDQVAFVVITGFPDAAVREGGFGDQGGTEVIAVGDASTERVGLFDQAREVIVLEGQTIPIGQADAGRIPRFIQIYAVTFAAEVAAGDDLLVLVVLHFELAAEDVDRPGRSVLEVVTEMKVFAVTGPMLNHARLAVDGLPAVVAAQAQCVAVTGHHAFGVAEPAHGIAIAIDHFDELAVVVVAVVLDEGFHRQVVDDAFDVGQAAKLRAIYFEHAFYQHLGLLRD